MASIKSILKACLNALHIALLRKRVIIGKNVVVNGSILLSGTRKIIIGDDVYINSNEKSNPIGGNIRCYFKTLRDGQIVIGNGSRLSNIAITSLSKVEIGSNVYLGGGAKSMIQTSTHSTTAIG